MLKEEDNMSDTDDNPWMDFGDKSMNITDGSDEETTSEEFCECAVSFESIIKEQRDSALQNKKSIDERNIEDLLSRGEVKNRVADSAVDLSCINDALKAFCNNSSIEGNSSTKDIWNVTHCTHCKKKIKDNRGQHFMTESCGNEIKCPICKETFYDTLIFTEHMFQHSQNYISQKNVPESTSESLQISVNKKKHKCEICLKEFNHKTNFNKHLLVHSGEKKFKCDTCNKGFSRKQKLSDHLPLHTNEREHECKLCSKCFVRKWDLKRHMLRHEGTKQYTCEICYKSFSCKKGLFDHSAAHTTEKSHVCEICNRSFTCKKYLSRHLQIHTRQIRLCCLICNRSFVNKGILARHVIIHDSERNYICEVCNKAFLRKGDVDRHRLIHVKPKKKPYRCQLCNRNFSSYLYLQKHQVDHSHGKLPDCERCGKHFSRAAYLRHVVSCTADFDNISSDSQNT